MSEKREGPQYWRTVRLRTDDCRVHQDEDEDGKYMELEIPCHHVPMDRVLGPLKDVLEFDELECEYVGLRIDEILLTKLLRSRIIR